jgi:hypothetical protein
MLKMLKRLALTILIGTALLPIAHRKSSPFEASAEESEGGRCGFIGSYGLTLQGKVPVGGDVTGVGIAVVDGKGNLTGSATGTASNWTPATVQSPVTGTYHLNDNCTGTFSLTFSSPASFTLQGTGVIVKEGKELHTVITSPAGFLLTGAGFKL